MNRLKTLFAQLPGALERFFKSFTLFETLFICLSLTAVVLAGVLCHSDGLTLAFSVVAVIAVFSLAKGVFIAPCYHIAMCILYALLSYRNGLYGEAILNAFILVPLLLCSQVNWLLNKKKNGQMQVNVIGRREWLIIGAVALGLVCPVFFALRALNTSYVYLSTLTFILPIVTNYLSLRRSVFQFVSNITQNTILIIVWLLPAIEGKGVGIGLIPTALTCLIFVVNACYGLYNWHRKYKEQRLFRQMKEVGFKNNLSKAQPYIKMTTKTVRNQNFKQKRSDLWNF